MIEPALVHRMMSAAEAGRGRARLYRELGLPHPERIGARYPHQLSGGQLQRLMASMAMSIVAPQFLRARRADDRARRHDPDRVLKAFKDAMSGNQGAAALYVSHDLAVVSQIADRVLVLCNGDMLEEAPTGAHRCGAAHRLHTLD